MSSSAVCRSAPPHLPSATPPVTPPARAVDTPHSHAHPKSPPYSTHSPLIGLTFSIFASHTSLASAALHRPRSDICATKFWISVVAVVPRTLHPTQRNQPATSRCTGPLCHHSPVASRAATAPRPNHVRLPTGLVAQRHSAPRPAMRGLVDYPSYYSALYPQLQFLLAQAALFGSESLNALPNLSIVSCYSLHIGALSHIGCSLALFLRIGY